MERLYGASICRKCYFGFIRRRQAAHLVDGVILNSVFLGVMYAFALRHGSLALGATTGAQATFMSLLALLIMFLVVAKDGLRGCSPGKALMGLKVVHRISRRPIGLSASVMRNLPLLFPPALVVALFQHLTGYRIGDGWARTQVRWSRYEGKIPFVAPAGV